MLSPFPQPALPHSSGFSMILGSISAGRSWRTWQRCLLIIKWFVRTCDKKYSGTHYKELRFCDNRGAGAYVVVFISTIMKQYYAIVNHVGSGIKWPGFKLGFHNNWLSDVM